LTLISILIQSIHLFSIAKFFVNLARLRH